MNLVYILIHLSNPTSYEVASWDGNKEGLGWDNLIPFLSRLSKSFLILVSLKKKKLKWSRVNMASMINSYANFIL